jgi:hypothetical protein
MVRRILLCLVVFLFAHSAHAYRRFNSTDAAVAARGGMELECARRLRASSGADIISTSFKKRPATSTAAEPLRRRMIGRDALKASGGSSQNARITSFV